MVQGPAKKFEELVVDLFRRQEFKVEVNKNIAGHEIDALVTSTTGVKAIVEVKLYRSRHVAASTLRNLAVLLEARRREAQADKAVLVMAAHLSSIARAELRAVPNLIIYDLSRLIWLLSGYPDLTHQLEDILRESDPYGTGHGDWNNQLGDSDRKFHEFGQEPQDIGSDQEAGESVLKPEVRGQNLCTELHELVKKRAAASKEERRGNLAREFENKCIDTIKYLFEDDLTSWRSQQATDNGISRFDLVARILPNPSFWGMISGDFGARYVVFEFKYYEKKIKQGEILTTEKYLYPMALRPVAIIISPLGADKNALETARGALREHGKLIINLTIEQLCKMLHAKDGTIGPDGGPADVEQELYDTLDTMLVCIER